MKPETSYRSVSLVRKLTARAIVALARMAAGLRVAGVATKLCNVAVGLDPDCGAGHSLMARIHMPGLRYLGVLKAVHERLRPRGYLEIGVATGRSLSLALDETRAIAVDPHVRIQHDVSASVSLYPVTSDIFFERYNLKRELHREPLDLVFVDGMHRYDFVIRDILNIEPYAHPETVLLFHDCLPLNRVSASTERLGRFWCGDVWKVIPFLRAFRPDLNIHVIKAYPSGLGLVTNFDPDRPKPDVQIREAIVAFQEYEDERLFSDREAFMNAVPATWEEIKALLPGASTTRGGSSQTESGHVDAVNV